MARNENDGWWMLAAAIAVGLLYYLQTGRGEGNDSAGIPEPFEDQIDGLIAELNSRFGKRWVDLGVAGLTFYLRGALPTALVTLIDVVAAVENESQHRPMGGNEKKNLALDILRGSKMRR